MAEGSTGSEIEVSSPPVSRQHLFIMRHGERLDSRNRDWRKTAARPYDTPITPRGEREALRLAKGRFAGKDIKLVYTSPFLRCIQTGHQVCNGLGLSGMHTCNGLSEVIAPECNMCEGPPEVPALENIASCGIKLLSIDHSGFAKWPETVLLANARYVDIFKRLADHHWPDNLLLVTHEHGVMQAMLLGDCMDDVEATYCGYVQLSRTTQGDHKWKIEQYHGVYKYDVI